MKLTAVILSKGEASTLIAIKSVYFADEILVILDTDEKLDFENNSRLTVLRHELAGDYSQQRNFAAARAKGDWLLYLDSDEEVTSALAQEIKQVISHQPSEISALTTENRHLKTHPGAYYLMRRDFFWGKELLFGETKTARDRGFIRLVKKNSGIWKGTVHEEFISEQKPSSLKGFIDHHPHQTISEYLLSINAYSSARAKELKNNGTQFSTLKMIFYPLAKFFYTYFVRLGFLDGIVGFAYSFMMSFHSFLVRAKLLNL